MPRILPIILMVLAAGTSAAAAGAGRVYFYAQREATVRSWLPVACSAAPVADLKAGTFFAIVLPAGRYSCTAGDGVPASIDLHSGEEIFVRLDWNYQLGRAPIPVLSAINPDRAKKEMLYLSYIKPGRARSSAVAKKDPRGPAGLQLKRR